MHHRPKVDIKVNGTTMDQIRGPPTQDAPMQAQWRKVFEVFGANRCIGTKQRDDGVPLGMPQFQWHTYKEVWDWAKKLVRAHVDGTREYKLYQFRSWMEQPPC
jgi:hypothetical protein